MPVISSSDRVARQACKRRNGDEAVAHCPQAIDDHRQRGDGLRTVAAGVVEQDHVAAALGIAGLDLRDRPVDDRLHARALPVVGIDVEPY
jgi:hypothetical protein